MPTEAAHLRDVRDNLATLEQLPETLVKWRITVRFYVALHLLDAPLERTDHTHPSSHQERNDLLWTRRYRVPSLAQYAYEQLERYSREARYDCPSSGRLERLNSAFGRSSGSGARGIGQGFGRHFVTPPKTPVPPTRAGRRGQGRAGAEARAIFTACLRAS